MGDCCDGDGGDSDGSGAIVTVVVEVVLVVIYRQITIIRKYVYLRRPPILCNI